MKRLILVFAIGFILGLALALPKFIKAQEPGTAHVYIVPVTVYNQQPTPANIPGVRIVGISCLPSPIEKLKLPNAAVCYVATTTAGN